MTNPKPAPEGSNEETLRAATNHVMDVTGELVRSLRGVAGSDDDLRWKYGETLWLVGQYLEKIGAGHDVAGHVVQLAIALCDLEVGIVDPALDPGTKVKGDPSRTWQGRMWVALGMECLLKSRLTREQAAQQAVARWPRLSRLIHGSGSNLPSSLLSWHDRFLNGEIKNRSVRKAFKKLYGVLGVADLAPKECNERARICFHRAIHFADDLSAE
jgi:hypothetical protein